jgi:dTDP-glucose pyrophosphorylase
MAPSCFKDITPNINTLAQKSTVFLRWYPAVGWSIAALFGTHCGTQLKPGTHNSNAFLVEKFSEHSPVACYTAILKQAGFKTAFMGGASPRGELEITDVNVEYLKRERLNVEVLGHGVAWLDMGTHESLLHASTFIETVENSQGLKICCPEKIAFHKGWISTEKEEETARRMKNTQYGKYFIKLIESR